MTGRTTPFGAGRCAASLFLALIVAFVGGLAGAPGAAAQSSVRPPANATSNALPLARGQVPARSTVSTNVTGGRVPGGALGSTSQSQIWRAIREGKLANVSSTDPQTPFLIRSDGKKRPTTEQAVEQAARRGADVDRSVFNVGPTNWRLYRNDYLPKYGMWFIVGVTVLLFAFLVVRGPIEISGGRSGRRIRRFSGLERLGHWMLAISFLVLAITGLNITYGRYALLPIMGENAFAEISETGKFLHNYGAFVFMAGLVWVFVQWVLRNLPSLADIKWILLGGGFLFKGVHPPAGKFNFGQKLIFWIVIFGGASLSLSGLSLLFPYQIPLFAKTFALLNAVGFHLPTNLSALQEVQLAQIWHSLVALFMTAVILAHIYIGSVGMEGAFDAVGSGDVDVNWAKEHHSLWYEEVAASGSDPNGSQGTAGPGGVPAPAE